MGPYACVDAFVRGKGEARRAGYLRNFVPLGDDVHLDEAGDRGRRAGIS